MPTWCDIRYFKPSEFDSPDEPGSGAHMNIEFVAKLDEIRFRVGHPLKINSGYRTPEHNMKIGGSKRSAHLCGCAADLSVTDSVTRMRIIDEALALGIRRIGVGPTFIHLDNDLELAQCVMWVYK